MHNTSIPILSTAKELSIYMQIVSVAPYNVNMGEASKKFTCYFYLFSDASNLISLQATYMKFAEYM